MNNNYQYGLELISSDIESSDVSSSIGDESHRMESSVGSKQVLFSAFDCLCQISQEIASYPFYKFYIHCQCLSNPLSCYYFPHQVIYPLFVMCRSEGIKYMWKGFSSHIVINSIITLAENNFNNILAFYDDSFRQENSGFIHKLTSKMLINFFIAPFYTSMLLDCMMSITTSANNSSFHSFTSGLGVIFGFSDEFSATTIPLCASKPLSLIQRYLAYSLYSTSFYFTQDIVYNIYKYICYRQRTFYLPIDNSLNSNNELSNDSIIVSQEGSYTQIESHNASNNLDFIDTFDEEMCAKFYSVIISDIITIPIFGCTIRCLLQGFNFILDTVTIDKTSASYFGFNLIHSSQPAADSYFSGISECIKFTKEDDGILYGFFKGVGALILCSLAKYVVFRAFKMIIDVYKIKYE